MTFKADDLSRACRGLAHEFSNILTYLLPAISETGECYGLLRDLLTAGGPGEFDPSGPVGRAVARLRAEFTVDDLERLERQLELGGQRVSLMFRDLKVGHFTPRHAAAVEVWSSLCRALPESGGSLIELEEPAEPDALLVQADPTSLGEILGRLLRAAVGWARTVHPAATVRVSLVRLAGAPSRVQVRALLVGDPRRLPAPEALLDMLCPSETGAERAERGLLGVLAAGHLLRAQGGELLAGVEPGGVALYAHLPAAPARAGAGARG